MDNLTGQVIKSYQVLEQLDAGGFGAVYRAYQPIIEREVALKVILPRLANEPSFIRSFEVEAQTVARLEHPYIVPLYDFWLDPNGAYLVMRLMRGGSLRDVIDTQEQIPIDEIQVYVTQIAAALTIAHRNSIIHRDLKPENILLDEDHNSYLTDFGIAHRKGFDDTSDDVLQGSVNYMPPEVIQGDTLTTQADIYSLGILIFEMLTGSLPFSDDLNVTERLYFHLSDRLPNLHTYDANLPDRLNDILQRATQKNPAHRYPSAQDFARDIQEIATDNTQVSFVNTIELQQVVDNPYKGLRPFAEADAIDFFGREALVAQIIDRLNEDHAAANFLAVVGPSGSGKSSVVQAGVLPRLRQGDVADTSDWFIADLAPGGAPIANLANALLSVSTVPLPMLERRLQDKETGLAWAVDKILADSEQARLLIFIDQFEEIFTSVDDDATRQHLLRLLIHAVQESSDVYVIVTIRADFFDKPLMYEGIGELIQSRTQVVLPLTAAEIEEVIVGPAKRVGLQVDRDLIAAIVADVREEPGALPLLQYALTELFEWREGNHLTLEAYEKSGRLQGALARRAQQVYDPLPDDVQDVTRQLFLRLVTLGEGTEDTRRRVKRSELLALGEDRTTVNQILDEFGKYRLLTFDSDLATREPTVEIAHEALIREWEQLRQWLDKSRNDIRLQRTLNQAAQEWDNRDRKDSFLLFSGRLLQYREWAQETSLKLTELEREYLQASIAEQERREAIEREQQERERALQERVLVRTRQIAIVMGIAVLITIGLTLFSFRQSEIAQQESQNAQVARATSDANAVAAQRQLEIAEERAAEIQNLNLLNLAEQAVLSGDTGLGLTLVERLASTDDISPTIQNALYDIAYSSQMRDRITAHTRKITDLAISPDGRYLATASEDLLIYLWDGLTGEQIGQLAGHRGAITDITFSPDSTQLASGGTDAQLIIWDIAAQGQITTLRGHERGITDVDYHPNGLLIATSSGDDTIILWNIEREERLRTYNGHSDSVRTISFDDTGERLISGSRDTSVIIWNTATANPINTLNGHNGSVQAVAVSPDGASIFSAAADRSVIWWDADSGTIKNRFLGHSDEITSVAVHPDGNLIASTSCGERSTDRTCIQGEVIVWNLEIGDEVNALIGHSDNVNSVVFSPDGASIVTASCGTSRLGSCIGGEYIVWDTQPTDDTIQMLSEHTSGVFSVATNASGDRILSGGGSLVLGDQPQGDTRIILWDADSGTALQRFVAHTSNVTGLAFYDDDRFLSASRDGTVRVWSIDDDRELRRFTEHTGAVHDFALSHDRQLVLSAGEERLLLWDYETGDIIHAIDDLGSQITAMSVAFSPDDSIFAAGLNNGTIILWDTTSGENLRRFDGHTDDVLAVDFTPDGTRLVSGSNDRSIRLWDVENGALVRRFDGHTDPVTTLNISATHIVSGSVDNSLRYWDIASGELIRIFEGHQAQVTDLTYDAQRGIMASASADGTLRVWRVSLEALVAWIDRHRYQRDLSDDEQQDLFFQ